MNNILIRNDELLQLKSRLYRLQNKAECLIDLVDDDINNKLINIINETKEFRKKINKELLNVIEIIEDFDIIKEELKIIGIE